MLPAFVFSLMAREYSAFNASFLVSYSEYFRPPSEKACNIAKVIILSFCNKEAGE